MEAQVQSLAIATSIDKAVLGQLVNFINPDFGLLDALLANGALSAPEATDVKNQHTVHNRNEKILEFVLRKGAVQKLATALLKTKQTHLVAYLANGGVYTSDFEDDWPLDRNQLLILDGNRDCLVVLIDPTAFTNQLLAKEVISVGEKDFIASKATHSEKNKALLDILRRTSRKNYKKAINCLRETYQDRIANILMQGVVVRIHASLTAALPNVAQTEHALMTQILAHLSGQSQERVESILRLVAFGLIAVRSDKGLVFFFHTKTLKDLVDLHDSLVKGLLNANMTSAFQELLADPQDFGVALDWKRGDYQREKLYFAGFEVVEELSESDFSDLPHELYQLILVKTYIHMTLVESRENRHPECGIFSTLSAVNGNWHKMVFTKVFKAQLDNYFSAYFNGIMKRATVVSNNRYYLSLHVTPKGLIDKLHHAECITDDDTRFIKCQTYDHDKIDETLSVIRDLNIEKYAVYVDCLRQTNQHLHADISEMGGVTVKGKSINEEIPNLEQLELKIVDRINQVRNKTVQRSPELEKELDFLRRHDVEILNAYHDKGIVIWFWVRSQNNLEQMLTWRDSDQVEPMFEKLFEVLGCWETPIEGHIKPDFVIMEGSMFDREVVNLPMMLFMISSLTLDVNRGPVKGVTSLQNNLYVLHSKSILVYESEKPFNYVREIPAPGFGSPVDVSACEKSQCLYVTDEANTCVWKVTPADSKVEKWLSNVGAPFTSSVSSNGDVLILRSGKPSFLEAYQSDAGLHQKLQLPDNIENPRHAMETRSGNYNILYEEALIEMTKNGLVTRQDKSFRVDKPLKAATHLALDVAERIYIAEGNRILLFDSQLVYERVILPEDRLRGPQRICHIREKKLLLVVHTSGSVVDVYNLRPRD